MSVYNRKIEALEALATELKRLEQLRDAASINIRFLVSPSSDTYYLGGHVIMEVLQPRAREIIDAAIAIQETRVEKCRAAVLSTARIASATGESL